MSVFRMAMALAVKGTARNSAVKTQMNHVSKLLYQWENAYNCLLCINYHHCRGKAVGIFNLDYVCYA
jgi:Pyruvate/2-oxoacid:ferredoxin oxidoreductase delta subunit